MRRRLLIGAVGSLALAAVLSLAGCEKPLFAKDQPRSPYERYQVLHNEQRPATEENAYGGEEPALRERLKPLDQP